MNGVTHWLRNVGAAPANQDLTLESIVPLGKIQRWKRSYDFTRAAVCFEHRASSTGYGFAPRCSRTPGVLGALVRELTEPSTGDLVKTETVREQRAAAVPIPIFSLANK